VEPFGSKEAYTAGSEAGRFIVLAGALLIIVGLVVWSGALGWFGRLPGDIRIERETVRVYVPIVSMLLLSVGFSVLLYLYRRFF
jgi:hypothetical protein